MAEVRMGSLVTLVDPIATFGRHFDHVGVGSVYVVTGLSESAQGQPTLFIDGVGHGAFGWVLTQAVQLVQMPDLQDPLAVEEWLGA